MRFSAPSTRRAGRTARRITAARARREEPACAASPLRERQVPAARRGLASPWTGRTNPRARPRRRANRLGVPATPSEIAAELGLGAALTLDQLTSRWRDFVWRNHPDRQPVDARSQANARMAIANALYDRARRELAKAR
jgi:hypothetical protein